MIKLKPTRIDRRLNVLWFGKKLVMGISLLAMIEPEALCWSETKVIASPAYDGKWSARDKKCVDGRWLSIHEMVFHPGVTEIEVRQWSILSGLLN